MINLKSYKEKQNEIVEKMQSILSSAKLETRALSSDEKTEYENLKAELDAIKETIKLLQEELDINEPMTEEEGKEEMTEKRSLSKQLLEERKIKVGAEHRNLMMKQDPGKKLVTVGVHNQIGLLADNDDDLIQYIPMIATEKSAMSFVRETDKGTKPIFITELEEITDSNPNMESVIVTSARIGSALTLSKALVYSSEVDIVDYCQKLISRRINLGVNHALIKGAKIDGTTVIVDGLEEVSTTGDVAVKTTGVLEINDVMNVLSAMPRQYVNGAKWVVSTEIFNALNKLQDANGNYYMIKDVQNDSIQYRLFGLQVVINDSMQTNLGADEKVLFLVNFEEAYKGIAKQEMNIELVEGTEEKRKSAVVVLGDTYLGARCTNPQAIKVLKGKA
ncbi:phage major capsid protein [Paraclostridium bifermentans]|uniref:phage major capsid protein n=1 Tax=Paraclostridium bifermentans TaxID=1490 RepID=UPI00241DA88F|nr:phage major capsid protein [Paraclostridium bifermentans]